MGGRYQPVCDRGEWFSLSSLLFCSSQALPSGSGSDRFEYTALHHLASFPRRYLKQEGGEAHINLQQQERWRVEVARILIRSGADPAQKDVEGKTAADLARAEGSIELARFLQQAITQRE